MTFDLLIRGGRVIDGSGANSLTADIGVNGERVAAIGDLREAAGRIEIGACGKVVCPGFMDIHTHSEITLLADPRGESKIRQGVTTEVVGNCGFGTAPVTKETLAALKASVSFIGPHSVEWDWASMGEYLDRLGKARPALNVAVLAGHIPIRAAVLGFENLQPNSQQLRAMMCLAEEALEQGALGLSAGLIYPPCSYAQTEELIALAEVVARHGRLFSIHVRDERAGLLRSVGEAIAIAEQSGCRLQVSHLKSAGEKNWGMVGSAIALIEKAVERGVAVAFDAYPYAAGSTTMTTLIPDEFHQGGLSMLLERLADPQTNRRILQAVVRTQIEATGRGDENEAFAGVIVGALTSEKNASWQGKRLVDFARASGLSPAEAALRLIVEEQGTVNMVVFVTCEEEIEKVVSHPLCAIGSDGLAISPSGPTRHGYCHPRYYGTYPHFLVRYVREKRLVSLEEAIRKMTRLPAQRLGLKDRGLLKPGHFADIVVMDYDHLTDAATYENPQQFPQGIEYVIVNGAVAVDKGGQTHGRAGKVL